MHVFLDLYSLKLFSLRCEVGVTITKSEYVSCSLLAAGHEPRCCDARRDRCGRKRRELRQKRVGRAKGEKDYRQAHAVGVTHDGAHPGERGPFQALSAGVKERTTSDGSSREYPTNRILLSWRRRRRGAAVFAAGSTGCKLTVGLSARQVPGGREEQPHAEQDPAVRTAGPI